MILDHSVMKNIDIDKKISEMIFDVYRMMKKHFELSSGINLTLIQLHGLLFIKENKNCQLSDLARAFSITLPTANSLVEKLINLKLVQKKQDKKDNRSIRLSLTKQGRHLIKKIVKQQKKCFSRLINKLNPKEKERLLSILKKLLV